MKNFIPFLGIMCVITGAMLYLSARHDSVLNRYADCVYHEARADGFKGTDREAWATYYEVCK